MYANIRNNEIIDFNSKYLNGDITRVETTQAMYELYKEDKSYSKLFEYVIFFNLSENLFKTFEPYFCPSCL